MAAVIGEALEGLAEGEEAKEGTESKGFSQDSQESAESAGVDIAKIVSAGLSIFSSIYGLLSAIQQGKEQTQDLIDKRHAAGLLLPTEDRKTLVVTNVIPAYWAASNIKNLLRRGKLPYGWSVVVAANQGFEKDIAAFLGKEKITTLAEERDAQLKRNLVAARIQHSVADAEKTFRLKEAIRHLQGSVL